MNPDGLHARLSIRRSDGFSLDADVAVENGSTLALIGPNGAGKSTVVAAVAGLIRIDSGAVRLNDVVFDDPESRVFVEPKDRRIGVMFQDGILFPHLSVRDNIGFGLRSRGIDRDEIEMTVDGWLDRLELRSLADRKPAEISGGEARRVSLARAIVNEPDLLILDEPLESLDVSTRSHVRSLIGRYLDEYKGPTLLIAHDPTEAMLLGDDLMILENGSVTHAGPPDFIRMHPKTQYAADVAGLNLAIGDAANGVVTIGSHRLMIPDGAQTGRVAVTFHPRTVALHGLQPEGSARNTWMTHITNMEALGSAVRIETGAPMPITAEVTPSAVTSLGLGVGSRVWVSIKATELGVESVASD